MVCPTDLLNFKKCLLDQLFYLNDKLVGAKGSIAVIAVESAVKYSFVLKGTEMRRKGQYNAELTLSPSLCVKSLLAYGSCAHSTSGSQNLAVLSTETTGQ